MHRGWGCVNEHQRGVCGSEGNGVHAVKHGECARGGGGSQSMGERCMAARAMVCMLSGMASALGVGVGQGASERGAWRYLSPFM